MTSEITQFQAAVEQITSKYLSSLYKNSHKNQKFIMQDYFRKVQ